MMAEGRRDRLWQGDDRARPGVMKLFWVVVRLVLASWVWGTAVRLAHFQPPFKTAGLALALLGILLAAWAVWGVGQAFLILGVKRLLIILAVLFGLLVAVNVLTVPDERPLGRRLWAQVSASGGQMARGFTLMIQTAAQAPDEFLSAYSGERRPPALPPGFPTPDPEATPVQLIETSGSGVSFPIKIPTPQLQPALVDQPAPSVQPTREETAGEQRTGLENGRYAIVSNTGSQSLLARAEPGSQSDIVARFPAGTRLLLLEGPVELDGYTWWKVRSDEGEEGWCADQWLAPAD